MALSDRDMMVVSQIAYMDFNQPASELENKSLREILQYEKSMGDSGIFGKTQQRYDAAMAMGNYEEAKRLKGNLDMYNEVMADDSKYGDWKMVNICDKNDRDGFYGCMLETGEGEAAIGFRGSESTDQKAQYDDWAKADFGLLNSTETDQQASAQKYMEYINEKYGDDYDSFELTGHSLGGNLAEHAAITAPDGMKAKFVRVLSIDGPGFSNEYIAAHKKEIDKVSHVLEHHQYSIVGALLNPLPGEKYRTIQVTEDGEKLSQSLNRHSTLYIKYDKDGNVIDGHRDAASWGGSFLSKAVDFIRIIPFLPFLPGMVDGFFDLNILRELIDEIDKIAESLHQRLIAGKADFKVTPTVLTSTASDMVNYVSSLGEMSGELDSIHREISIVLKAASLFTLCYRLKKYKRDIEKEMKKMNKMSEAARNCGTYYSSSENKVVSGAAV